MATFSPQQVLDIANQFSALGDTARALLTDASVTLSPDQSNVTAADMSRFYDTASNLATLAATLTFADTETTTAFNAITSATKSANDAVQTLKKDAKNINSIMNIMGSAVSLVVALGSGNGVTVITKAAELVNTVTSSTQ